MTAAAVSEVTSTSPVEMLAIGPSNVVRTVSQEMLESMAPPPSPPTAAGPSPAWPPTSGSPPAPPSGSGAAPPSPPSASPPAAPAAGGSEPPEPALLLPLEPPPPPFVEPALLLVPADEPPLPPLPAAPAPSSSLLGSLLHATPSATTAKPPTAQEPRLRRVCMFSLFPRSAHLHDTQHDLARGLPCR